MKKILGLVIVLGLMVKLPLVAQGVKSGNIEVIDLGKGVKLEMVLVPAASSNCLL